MAVILLAVSVIFKVCNGQVQQALPAVSPASTFSQLIVNLLNYKIRWFSQVAAGGLGVNTTASLPVAQPSTFQNGQYLQSGAGSQLPLTSMTSPDPQVIGTLPQPVFPVVPPPQSQPVPVSSPVFTPQLQIPPAPVSPPQTVPQPSPLQSAPSPVSIPEPFKSGAPQPPPLATPLALLNPPPQSSLDSY